MVSSEQLHAVAEQLFTNFTNHDFDAVEAMLVPDAQITQNGNRNPWAVARPHLEGLRAVLGDHRYEDVRRVVGTNAIVEEHAVRSTTPGGIDVNLAACVVIRVNDDGLIVSLDEYVDPTSLL